MNFILYFIIFISKTIELALGTLRIIVIANGKKLFGAILQGIIAIVWMCITGVVIVNITKDPFKIIAFALGSAFGSYIGSFIEEKMTIENNLLLIITKKELEKIIIPDIKKHSHSIINIKNYDKDKSVLIVVLTKKDRKKVTNLIKNIDKNAIIVIENTINSVQKRAR